MHKIKHWQCLYKSSVYKICSEKEANCFLKCLYPKLKLYNEFVHAIHIIVVAVFPREATETRTIQLFSF